MSEKLCALRKIGGGMSETVLWSNSAPTSDFATQTVTLADAISNYKFIAFDSIGIKTASVDDFYRMIVSVDDAKRSLSSGGNYIAFVGGYFYGVSGYTRAIFYVGETSIKYDSCWRVGGSGTVDNLCIPLRIVGLK